MKLTFYPHIFLAALVVAFSTNAQQPKVPFQFHDGDRVAFVGDTLIEREQAYGYIEERLTVQYPNLNVTFRNLGWSADRPTGISRSSFDFDKPGKSFEKLKDEIAAISPTVVIVGYGMANSFDGEAGTAKFKTEMNELLDAIRKQSTNKAPVRFIFFSPVYQEKSGANVDLAKRNADLARYTHVIDSIATERSNAFVNLYDLLGDGSQTIPPRAFTENGIHMDAFGYLRAAESMEKHIYWDQNFWRVGITADGKVTEPSYGTKVSDLAKTSDSVRFTAIDDKLVLPKIFENGKIIPTHTADCLVQVAGLKSGNYELKIDGKVVASDSAKNWARGVVVDRGAQFEQAEELRHAIIKKNELYFYRWRPANETYLLGFRKYEQGQNAKEMPMFEPLVAEQEKKIATLRKPIARSFELVRGKSKSASAPSKKKLIAENRISSPAVQQPLPDFDVAPGFEVNLFAETPLLNKPVDINFDPSGRLWVAGSSTYPQIAPGKIADDKIILLEDTDGDGRADKSSIFADGLLIPNGVVPGDGGIYVAQSTELLFLKDTDGDGRADVKKTILSGFGTEDTHHTIHRLHWGFDGRLYFNQSIYIHSHAETPNGVVRLNSGGIFRFDPRTLEADVLVRGFVNPWGHQFDAFGQSFVTDGAGGGGINYGLPGAMFQTYEGARKILGSVSPGSYPKFCGLEIIRSEHFPKDWQGNAITCDFRAHHVTRFAIEEKDSAYATKQLPDLLSSTNVTFRPVDVKLGPDGALYIADWSNPIIQHGEVDFRDPRRDHENGRIWRVTAKKSPLTKKINFEKAKNSELLNQLVSPNSYNQQQARRVLTERGAKVLPDLTKWMNSQKSEAALLEALWMYQSLNSFRLDLLQKLIVAKDGRIRAAATRVLGEWHDKIENPIEPLAKLIADEHPRVRLEAARALARIPTARSAELVLSALDKPMDSFLDYALWLSINDLAKPWLAAVKSGEWKADGREKQLEFALKSIEPSLGAEVLALVLKDKTIPRDGSGPWIDLIGTAGSEKELGKLFNQVLQNGFDDAAKLRALKALNEASRLRSAKPTGELHSITELFNDSDKKIRAEAIRLAGRWKLEKVIPQLVESARDEKNSGELRTATFDSLRELGGAQVIAGIQSLTDKETAPKLRQQAVLTLAALDFSKAKEPLLDVLLNFNNETNALTFWRDLLKIQGATTNVLHILPKTDLPQLTAKAGLRAAREGGRNEPDLIFALTRAANLEEQSLSATEIQQLAKQVAKEGDAARGEKIYRRKELSCTVCHSIGGVGGKVAPDMTSLGASAQVDYIIESIFYPNRKVKEGFNSVLLETKDDEVYSGILVRDGGDQIVLRDATGKEISVAKTNVKNRSNGGSLMPSGLVDTLTPAERVDLFRFISELGKPGAYDASKPNVARYWKLLASTIDLAQFGDERVLTKNFTNNDWLPSFTFVDGRLPKEELVNAKNAVGNRASEAIYAATQFQVAKAGEVRMKLSGAANSTAWIDGKALKTGDEIKTELASGLHTLILKFNSQKLPESVRAESADATFLGN